MKNVCLNYFSHFRDISRSHFIETDDFLYWIKMLHSAYINGGIEIGRFGLIRLRQVSISTCQTANFAAKLNSYLKYQI